MPDSPALSAKVKAYERREPLMRRQRLTPDFPDWPATCFYPDERETPGRRELVHAGGGHQV